MKNCDLLQILLSTIGITIYSALLAIIAYIITPAESAFGYAIITFVVASILLGVFIYFHPGPIVANVP